VNGTIVGLTRYPARFVAHFRKLRRAGKFSEFVSVYINNHHRTVNIACDGGRICRPMIIVENARPRVTTEHITVRVRHPKRRKLRADTLARCSRRASSRSTTSSSRASSSTWT
jgi:DNA-directed RNA polymerase beta subunit